MHGAISTRLNSARDAGRGHDPLQFQANSFVGVIDDPTAIRPLVAALSRSGIDADQVAVIHEAEIGRPGRLERMHRQLQVFGPEAALRGRYEAELHDGHALIVIHGVQRHNEFGVRQALRASDAHCVHVFGRFTVTSLDA